MAIKLSIDVGLHDVYSVIDVDFPRECENEGTTTVVIISNIMLFPI